MKYVAQLDGVRFFAVVSVIIAHWIVWDTSNEFVKSFPWSHGVILFFVLSGYLITSILLDVKQKVEAGEANLKEALTNFYIRRVLRIFPVYYVTIIFLKLVDFKNVDELSPWLFTFSSNLYQAFTCKDAGQFVHFWSLAIEEQFYLFWPLLILAIKRSKIFKLMVVVMVFSVISRVLCFLLLNENWMLTSYFTLNLMMPLALGGLIALLKSGLYNKLPNIFNRKELFYISGFVYFLFYYGVSKSGVKWIIPMFDEYLFALFAAFFIGNCAESNFKYLAKAILENKIVVYIGSISYGMYVYHMFVINLYLNYVAVKLDIHTSLKYTFWIFYAIILVLLASISYYLLERPLNGLKKYFPYYKVK